MYIDEQALPGVWSLRQGTGRVRDTCLCGLCSRAWAGGISLTFPLPTPPCPWLGSASSIPQDLQERHGGKAHLVWRRVDTIRVDLQTIDRARASELTCRVEPSTSLRPHQPLNNPFWTPIITYNLPSQYPWPVNGNRKVSVTTHILRHRELCLPVYTTHQSATC